MKDNDRRESGVSGARFETPEWLRDGKFGIYTHWGVYSVHACGPNTTWYAHHLYKGSAGEREHFEKHFGSFGEHGYTDLIPLFTASRFDPDEWAQVFKGAGARFAGPVAVHHDGFCMWRTSLTPFNSWDMGPKRDVVQELERAYRNAGLDFMLALHHAENYWYLPAATGTDGEKPENVYMFSKQGKWTFERFCKWWYDQCAELIDRFSPQLLWFDFGLKSIPDAWKRAMLDYYFNKSASRGINPAVCYKFHDLQPERGIIDLELGRFNDLRYHDWITDTTIDAGQAWGYMEGAQYKSGAQLIHYLVDNVSKNGYMLLNVGPTADGTIPEEAKKSLGEIGAWLRVNGEAIYGTRPWYAYGEGPGKMLESGMFSESEQMSYTSQDIRYTCKDDCVYAIALARPEGEIVFGEIAANLVPGEITDVRLLGVDRPLAFKPDGSKLLVEFPSDAPLQAAYAFRVRRDPDILSKLREGKL